GGRRRAIEIQPRRLPPRRRSSLSGPSQSLVNFGRGQVVHRRQRAHADDEGRLIQEEVRAMVWRGLGKVSIAPNDAEEKNIPGTSLRKKEKPSDAPERWV